jgi:hypothetical protein
MNEHIKYNNFHSDRSLISLFFCLGAISQHCCQPNKFLNFNSHGGRTVLNSIIWISSFLQKSSKSFIDQ